MNLISLIFRPALPLVRSPLFQSHKLSILPFSFSLPTRPAFTGLPSLDLSPSFWAVPFLPFLRVLWLSHLLPCLVSLSTPTLQFSFFFCLATLVTCLWRSYSLPFQVDHSLPPSHLADFASLFVFIILVPHILLRLSCYTIFLCRTSRLPSKVSLLSSSLVTVSPSHSIRSYLYNLCLPSLFLQTSPPLSLSSFLSLSPFIFVGLNPFLAKFVFFLPSFSLSHSLTHRICLPSCFPHLNNLFFLFARDTNFLARKTLTFTRLLRQFLPLGLLSRLHSPSFSAFCSSHTPSLFPLFSSLVTH